ncbi:hypothetical protein HU200_009749 [Digitaria exilis]|uniref:Glabrous enhancer-binding protein-like DBD domain-containing protein n=1 Tax=Digitaria exilis TaxID=1010633 RepID=A0A835FLF9_9POAL|nr:hypothetical protein HU200_009749 [Digitaria exilis]
MTSGPANISDPPVSGNECEPKPLPGGGGRRLVPRDATQPDPVLSSNRFQPNPAPPSNPDPNPAAMADDHPLATAASSSVGDDDEGTDTDASNSELANHRDPPPLTDATSAPPPPPAAASAPEPTGAAPPPPPPPPTQTQGAGAGEDSRRLFQRLWTDEEELLILRGFRDFTARRGTTFASHQYDTGPFYEEIRRQLSFEFTKSQLIEKLRRLKKKRGEGAGDASDEDDINPAAAAAALPNATEDGGGGGASASATTPRGKGGRRVRRRTAQESEAPALPATSALMYEAVQEPLVVSVENLAPAFAPPPPVQVPIISPVAATPSPMPATANGAATEEVVRTIISPLLREFVSSVGVAGQAGPGLGLGMGFGGMGGFDILGLGFGAAGPNPGTPGDEKWRQQQILELEVYLKRIELVREQVTAALQELRSSEG